MFNGTKFVVFFMSVFAVCAMAQSIGGNLEKVKSARASELRYHCTLHGANGDLRSDVVLDTTNNFLTADWGDDVLIKGFASETVDKKTGLTYYFLQGGSEPFSQRLTLVTRDGGKWARFTKNFGADEFVCEM